MKPFFVLIAAFIISITGCKLVAGSWDVILAGNIAMACMLLFTAIGHFVYTKGMILMLPPIIPAKKLVVYFTGIVEVAAAIGLLLVPFRHVTAVLLIVFFLLLLPANIYAAINRVNYQAGDFTGEGVRYLWTRIPLQLLFIEWVCYFSL